MKKYEGKNWINIIYGLYNLSKTSQYNQNINY